MMGFQVTPVFRTMSNTCHDWQLSSHVCSSPHIEKSKRLLTWSILFVCILESHVIFVKNLGLPADAVQWTEELSISSFPSLAWWPSVSTPHHGGQSTQNWDFFLTSLGVCCWSSAAKSWCFRFFFSHECLPLSSPHWKSLSVYLGSVRQLSR